MDCSKIKCPSCSGRNLQYITETETKVESTGGGYSGAKGCLGYLLLGPFGLLCGNCGNSQRTMVTDTHKHFWVCSDCGCKFPTLEDLKEEIQQKRDALKAGIPVIISCTLLIFMGIGMDIMFLTILGMIFALLIVVLYPLLKKEIETKELEYEELKKKIKL